VTRHPTLRQLVRGEMIIRRAISLHFEQGVIVHAHFLGKDPESQTQNTDAVRD
jgi:hypothetical protein